MAELFQKDVRIITDQNENRPGYKKTKVGWVPNEWTPIALREIGVMRSGGTHSKKVASFWKGNIPWFTAKDLKFLPFF